MKEQEKKDYLEGYKKAKEKGVPFFPDIIFKDAIAALLIFIVLAALAYFIGVPMEARADPNDAAYTPRPEWYFLFLFQLLKYFPGKFEVVGVMIIPGLFILLLIALPFIDRSPARHFMKRPFASLSALVVVGAIATLTILAVREAPPPAVAAPIDQAAALYAKNCANCHGSSINVPVGTDLHQLIAHGKHEGMPAWGGDLSTDEIDALAGFITSPNGSRLYTKYCGDCHKSPLQASGNPQELQRAFAQGSRYPGHQNQNVPEWMTALTEDQRNSILNFLAAPDGQRLFEVNCSGCHGYGVTFSGTAEELRDLIGKGGQHLTMPAWQGTLSQADLATLASYVTDPVSNPAGTTLFGQHCSVCHGDKVPSAPDVESARKVISTGGAHVTMPVWGKILTPEQLDALVQYTLTTGKAGGKQEGAKLFADNCAVCHGKFGEGGPNPANPSQTIVPISSAEFLNTRDDVTLRSIISQGQPNFGMSPFGSANGGPLSDDQIDALVAYMRTWQANPPVDLPTEMAPGRAALNGPQVFDSVCARCHGAHGEGGIGPAFNTQDFQDRYDDQALLNTISEGREATPMIAWGEVLSPDQLRQLVQYIRTLNPGTGGSEGAAPPAASSFSGQVSPLLKAKCQACHNSGTKLGGWDSSSYETVMASGDNGPVVVAGDVKNSLLAQLIQGLNGKTMPPAGGISQQDIQTILDWIAAGAKNN